MIDIILKENKKNYTLPLKASDWAEIKSLIDDSVINDYEFEVDTNNAYYDMLPLHADLEQLDKIAKDLEVLENRTEINWLRAIYDADELGKITLKTSLLKQSKIEAAIAALFEKKYYFDECMDEADYAKQEYNIGNLDYLNISEEVADCLDWEKIYDKFLAEKAIKINGGILTIV